MKIMKKFEKIENPSLSLFSNIIVSQVIRLCPIIMERDRFRKKEEIKDKMERERDKWRKVKGKRQNGENKMNERKR